MWKPATSSLSASGMSNGVRFVSASAAMKKMIAATGWNEDEPEPRCAWTSVMCDEVQAVERDRLAVDLDLPAAAGAHHQDDRQRREDQRNLVGDVLGHRPHRPEQGVLVVRPPPGHEDADHREAAEREDQHEADVEVR